MSGRKTEEIKLRLTSEEKASWQVVAELEQTTVSELIRREMNARARMGPSSAGVVRGSDAFSPREAAQSTSSNPDGPVVSASEGVFLRLAPTSPHEDEGAKEAPIKPTSDCHNHQCSRKGCGSCDYRTTGYVDRRSEPCACGKQPYVFCQPCDG